MARPKILTTITQPDGWILVLYQQLGVYKVGVLSSHGRPTAVAHGTFDSYGCVFRAKVALAQFW